MFLDSLRYRLGGRPQLHRLRALAARRDHGLYEGKAVGTPDAGAFWRVVAEHKSSACSRRRPPSARLEEDSEAYLRRSMSRRFALCFSPVSAPIPIRCRAEKVLKIPIIDHWWQTETGWCIAGNPLGLGGLPVKHGSASVAMPGYDVTIVDRRRKTGPARRDGLDRRQIAFAAGALPTLCSATDI